MIRLDAFPFSVHHRVVQASGPFGPCFQFFRVKYTWFQDTPFSSVSPRFEACLNFRLHCQHLPLLPGIRLIDYGYLLGTGAVLPVRMIAATIKALLGSYNSFVSGWKRLKIPLLYNLRHTVKPLVQYPLKRTPSQAGWVPYPMPAPGTR